MKQDPVGLSSKGARTIVVVDDRPTTIKGTVDLIRSTYPSWEVWQTIGGAETKQLLGGLAAWPDLISVDLGIDDDPLGHRRGMELIRHIAKSFSTVPIVAHSGQTDVSAAVIRDLLSLKVSYVRLVDETASTAYVALLPFLVDQHLILSPGVRQRVPDAVAVIPDPLKPAEWATCRRLSEGLTYAQVVTAEVEGTKQRAINPDSMEKRVATIVDKLVKATLIDPPRPGRDHNKQALIDFYGSHGARYCRTEF